MTMLRSILVAAIFNAMFSTCYEQPVWNNLVVLKKTVPHDTDPLPPFKRMAPTLYSRYEIQPGSHGMFSDIAQGIQSRMQGIAKGPFIVVFDYGGIAPKYFSIIEDMASGSGVKVGPLGTVMVEPPGIVDQFPALGERVVPVPPSLDVGRPLGTWRYFKPTAAAVPQAEETAAEIPAIPRDNPVTSTMKKVEVEPPTELLISSTVPSTGEPIASTPVRKDVDPSASNGIVSMMKLIMRKPKSSLETIIPPSSTALALESITGGENIPSTTGTFVPIGSERSQANEPTATKSSVEVEDGGSGKVLSKSGMSMSLLKDIEDRVTSSITDMANPASALKGDSSPSSTAATHKSASSEEDTSSTTASAEIVRGENSLLKEPSDDKGEDTLTRTEAEPSATTVPMASTVPSTDAVVSTPVEIEATLSTTFPPSSVTSTVEPIMETPVSLPSDEPSATHATTSALKTVEANPSAIMLPGASAIESAGENVAHAPMRGDSSADSGNTSITNSISTSKENNSPSTTAETLPFVNTEENIPLLTGTVVKTEGEQPLNNDHSDFEAPIKPVDRASGKDPSLIEPSELQKTEAKPSTVTIPSASEVSSTVNTSAETPASITKDESTTKEGVTLTMVTRQTATPTVATTPAQVIIPKNELSANQGVISTTESTVAEPSTATSPTNRTKEVKMKTPVSIFKDGSSIKDGVTMTPAWIVAEPPTAPQGVSTETLLTIPSSNVNHKDIPSGDGIASTTKVIIMNPSTAVKGIISQSSNAATLGPINTGGNMMSTETSVLPNESELSVPNEPNAIESTVRTVDPSGKDPSEMGPSKLKSIEAKPIAIMLPALSTESPTVHSYPNTNLIPKDGSGTNDGEGKLEAVTAGPTASTTVVATTVSLPHDDSSTSNEVISALKSIIRQPSTAILPTTSSTKEITVETPLSILEEGSIKDGVTTSKWVEDHSPPSTTPQTASTETIVKTPMRILNDDSPLGGGTASTIELITTTASSALKEITSPSSTAATFNSINSEESIPSTVDTALTIEHEISPPHDPNTIETVGMASGKYPSGIGLKSIEEKSEKVTLPMLSSDSSAVHNLNTYILIPKHGSKIIEGKSLMRSEAKPSIATLPASASRKETILEDNSPTKDGVTSSLNSIDIDPSEPSPQTARVEDVNIPVDSLNDSDSASGKGIASTMKVSMSPSSSLKVGPSPSSIAASHEVINPEENVPSTVNTGLPTEGEQALQNEPTVTPTEAVDGASESGSSDVGLGRSLLKGITDGVTTSIASAGSGIASMMKLIMSPVSAVAEMTSPTTTEATLESIRTEENIPLTISKAVPLEDERPAPSSTAAEPHTKPVDWASGKDPSGIGLSKSLLKDIAGGVRNGLDGVRAIEFPGKTSIALLYPDQHVSVADKSTNEIMYFTALTNAAVNAGDAQSLYISLKPVTTEVSLIIKNRGFNCVPLRLTKLNLNLYVVDSIVFGNGNICGLENMQPGNMVTITKDDDEVMEVTMPLVLKDLTVRIDAVDVSNYFFTIIKSQPIEANVKEISCKGTFTFRKGTPFELTSFRMEWGDITGVHLKLEGALEEGSKVSGIIDNIASALSGVIKRFISPILDEIEKQITKSILGS